MSRPENGNLTRRDFLRTSGLALGLGLTGLPARAASTAGAKACIQVLLVGGPSQLDTWDPKPAAPVEVRGPFQPIRTNVPGILLSEHFPRMARRADRFAVLRSVYHQEAPIHETGQQLLQTGRLCTPGIEWPHFGAVISQARPSPRRPSWVLLPRSIHDTGVDVSHGQTAGFLDACHQPHGPHSLDAEPEALPDRYGRNPFGQSCFQARRLIEAGVRTVTVNMFETVFGQVTWDCHANGSDLPATLDDYRDTLCPMLDQAYTALLDDLEALGLLETTLVVCGGEFGRTPRVNSGNGRDHWPGVWSMLLAGGGVKGGQVIGASDRLASEPCDRPIHASEIAATVYHALGVDPRPYTEAAPVRELF